jgi:predicted PhzF superfamily epimerase YddE/YHI9
MQMNSLAFHQTDVFTAVPFKGNPVRRTHRTDSLPAA